MCSDIHWGIAEIDIREKRQTPLLLYHGEADDLISMFYFKMSTRNMKSHGIDHMEVVTEKGHGHSLSLAEIRKIKAFFIDNMLGDGSKRVKLNDQNDIPKKIDPESEQESSDIDLEGIA